MPTLSFTNGNDSYIVSAAGTYSLSFLAGDDTLDLRYASAMTVATMGIGNDVVIHRGGTADVDGDAGGDRFEIYASGLIADGGADNDLFNIRGGSGQTLFGGLGNDRFNFAFAATNVDVDGGAGDDEFAAFDLAITGEITGGEGSDRFSGFRGGVALFGGAGNDVYRVNPVSSAVFIELAGGGRDTVQLMRGGDLILLDQIEDVVVGTYAGSDTTGATISLNNLANKFTGHGNAEVVFGRGGDDYLNGKGGDDDLYGDEDNDTLDGGAGDDFLDGGAGNDRLIGRTGADTMYGGFGDDTYYITTLDGDVIEEEIGGGTDLVRVTGAFMSEWYMPDWVENAIQIGEQVNFRLHGNGLDNVITGTTGWDELFGGGGNDTLKGGVGNDYLRGGDGGDTLIGGLGDDTMEGGAGNDIYYLGNASDSVVEAPFGGSDALYVDFSASFYFVPNGVEDGYLTSVGSDTDLYGNVDDNQLFGTSSDNDLFGEGGYDSLFGLAGNDRLSGGAGIDSLDGGSGDDVLWGGAAHDHLTGGEGRDTFLYLSVSDSTGAPPDEIKDFASLLGEGSDDQLDLSAIDANTTLAGDQAFVFNTSGEPLGVAGDLWQEFSQNPDLTWNINLYGDVNGDSIADFQLFIQTTTTNFWWSEDITF